jgi:hypothetical protein
LTGTTVSLNNVPYYIPPFAVSSIESEGFRAVESWDFDFLPITVIHTDSHSFDESDLSLLTANFTQQDDVFQIGFLQGMQFGDRD